ncbi:hypothetical protein RVX_R21580 [Nitratidesulfovibrio sp. HK-II]|uniref:hypothetical protein n=1 Tax=Nitratidesulfovibrio sp. HK-II TaxID=2009266 RepID=UPI0011C072DB|nr:hypothetical protein [Nitratidesulfovibrio sp. HK-II]
MTKIDLQLRVRTPSGLWRLLLQEGVCVPSRVECTLRAALEQGMGFPREDVDTRMEAIFLDGRPVDDIDAARLHDGARLSLATALPGAAGIAMRRNSPYAALRAAITHHEQGGGTEAQSASADTPRQGRVHLRLFNLVMRDHAARLLAAGVEAPAGGVARYLAGDEAGEVWLDDARCEREAALRRLAEHPGGSVRLVVEIAEA